MIESQSFRSSSLEEKEPRPEKWTWAEWVTLWLWSDPSHVLWSKAVALHQSYLDHRSWTSPLSRWPGHLSLGRDLALGIRSSGYETVPQSPPLDLVSRLVDHHQRSWVPRRQVACQRIPSGVEGLRSFLVTDVSLLQFPKARIPWGLIMIQVISKSVQFWGDGVYEPRDEGLLTMVIKTPVRL